MLNKAQGQPTEDMAEYQRLNPASFGANVSDAWTYEAVVDGTPARLTHQHDTTAYASPPVEDSWLARLHGWTVSPARVAAGTAGTRGRGQVP